MSRALQRFRRTDLICAVLILLAAGCTVQAASRFDPALRFRTLTTAHFVIYFDRGQERLARRLAAVAENVWQTVGDALHRRAPRLTHVVLADQSELANGWATPLPVDTIMVTAAAPAGSEFIGRTDDWLRLVFTHEFTHIVHLDRSEGWARPVRWLFGRAPLAFPNLFLPAWQIEGLAAWQESALTGQGRLHAGDFRAIEHEAAAHGRLEPLDRINGGVTDWPGGLGPYAYGLGFQDYLVERFGGDRLAALADQTARSIPFTGSRAFKRVFDQPLGSLWKDYLGKLENVAEGPNQPNPPTRVTFHGHTVVGPRFASARCSTCAAEIVYSVRSPDGFPSLRTIGVDGSQPRRLTDRYLGATTGQDSGVLVFDQQEIRRNVGLYSDLFIMDRVTSRVRRLTTGARLLDPDLAPDGRSIACVREGNGQRDLVLVDVEPTLPSGLRVLRTTTLIAEAETQFNTPRFSPDGRSLAVERRRLGSLPEIVVVDLSDRTARPLAANPGARIVTPAWRPDGRAIIAAADFGEQTFNLYEFAVDQPAAPPRQLTGTSGGATWPDISPDGRTIVFVGYTVDGFDLFTIPYDGGGALADPATLMPLIVDSPNAVQPVTPPGPLQSSGYAPWPTLVPRSWSPIIESSGDQFRAGATTGGSDVLGRHAYVASATWLVSAPDRSAAPRALVPDWQLAYAYDRWRPTVFLAASSDTYFSAGPADPFGRPTNATLRRREGEAGLLVPVRHVRAQHRALASMFATRDDYTFAGDEPSFSRNGTRIGWASNTAQIFGYSVSPESGLTIGGTGEFVRRGLGASGDATTVTADARVYLPGFAPHHVLALRTAGGTSTGADAVSRFFHLGGASSDVEVLDFGRSAISLLRGFAPDTFAGTHVALVNADYRWPIARPQRGAGTWPVLLHTIHGALFADSGHAWSGRFALTDVKLSAGAEVSFDLVAGYWLPLTATAGAAWGRDGAGIVRNRGTFYVRIGRAF